jgi:HEAT repeat protein
MKKSIVLLALLLVIAYAIPAMAKDDVYPLSVSKALIEDNLFNGMASDNLGLQRGCALMLGKMQSERAVIPLKIILQNSTDENMRIAAAWALCSIGDERGLSAVKLASQSDNSPRVQLICQWYYESYKEQGSFTIQPPELPLVASAE